MSTNGYQTYFKEIKQQEEGTEQTLRTYLQNLLDEIKPDKNIKVIQEPKLEEGISGRPDFKIEKNGLVIGYIETKKLGANLDDIISGNASRDSEQLEKYLKVIPNLILTNYNEFILFKNKVPVDRNVLFYPSTDKRLNKSNIPNTERLIKAFFSYAPQLITNPKKLSSLLAERTILFRDFLKELLESDEDSDFKDNLLGVKEVIEETLIQDFKKEDFIDTYAQTITYGLFLAEINSKKDINEDNAYKFIPKSMGILKDLFKTINIEDIPDSVDWILEEIIDILNKIDKDELKNKLSFSQVYGYEDPYVYFYENFLGEYDSSKRKSKGVYYTPIPVVNFIVKSIDYLIKKDFNSEGLKGEDIKVLDFATGTGTFLLEAFKKALENTDEGVINNLIKERLLKNYYGFEYLIAPYSIAHLKLSQFLKESGYNLEDDERLKIYLTDTLDNSVHKGLLYFTKITKEGQEANLIKLRENILVMMGNPPYSNYSSGVEKEGHQWIKKLLNDYKEGLNETKINIDDDYIKFLRYAQWKIDKNGCGIVGVITNNSYLDGITHRIMRKSLLDTFDEIFILNLHGNKFRKEPDENVFDVTVGVSIALFIKLPEPIDNTKVFYYSTLENRLLDRDLKYGFLLANMVSDLDWKEIEPTEPNYWFVDKNLSLQEEYNKAWSLTDIFNEYNSGIQTGKDSLVIDYDKDILLNRIMEVLNNDDESEIREKYNLKDTSGWKLSRFKKSNLDNSKVMDFNYRPFDNRLLYYGKYALKRDRYKTMKYLIDKKNIGLVTVRQVAENKLFNHALITDKIIDMRITTSRWGTAFLFPLFIYDEELDEPKVNFSPDFIKFIVRKYRKIPPIRIFSYIYAVLYSPTYRERYNEFLKTDFPKIPFTEDIKRFKLLSKLGFNLINVHLLKNEYYDSELAIYPINGDNRVDRISYNKENLILYINDEQFFKNVPNDVWDMEIGGYKVLEKWLQYRKKDGKKLSFTDVSHFQKLVRALYESISIIADIDQVYKKIDIL